MKELKIRELKRSQEMIDLFLENYGKDDFKFFGIRKDCIFCRDRITIFPFKKDLELSLWLILQNKYGEFVYVCPFCKHFYFKEYLRFNKKGRAKIKKEKLRFHVFLNRSKEGRNRISLEKDRYRFDLRKDGEGIT